MLALGQSDLDALIVNFPVLANKVLIRLAAIMAARLQMLVDAQARQRIRTARAVVTRAASAPRTSVAVTWVVAVAAVVVMAWVVWGLRGLIVPAFVGGVLAYICRPLVAGLERRRIPRGVAAGLLLLTFASVVLVGLNSLRAAMPTEIEALELRVRALRALTRSYQTIMGLDASWTRGNRLYWLTHRDLDPLVDRVSEVLALTPDEQAQLVASRSELLDDERANAQTRAIRAGLEPAARTPPCRRPTYPRWPVDRLRRRARPGRTAGRAPPARRVVAATADRDPSTTTTITIRYGSMFEEERRGAAGLERVGEAEERRRGPGCRG